MKKIKIILSILALSLIFVACSDKKQKETQQETVNETVKESVKETMTETQKETENNAVKSEDNIVVEDKESGSDNPKSKEINVKQSEAKELNSDLTAEMQNFLKDYSVTLIESDDLNYNQFPKENLQAIAKYETKDSIGYVVRYGENKIGNAVYYKESTTGVFVVFNGENILGDNNLIKNDSPEEYKEAAKKIIASQVSGEADIKYAY
ncbi:hypothetical protein [Helcococcus massiliensis]|uniref:hypothetical protein n=1 Tax=Helcococcus massiliensis TaxID=2040290 RepID=UPI000CDEC4A1|nr:hypothetical protein [Helcococcus massiliensis]